MNFISNYKLYKKCRKQCRQLRQQLKYAESLITSEYTVYEWEQSKMYMGKNCVMIKYYNIAGPDNFDVVNIESSYCDKYSDYTPCSEINCPCNKKNAEFFRLKKELNQARMMRNKARRRLFGLEK